MSTAAAPLEIGTVRLVVNDLTKVADFYARALGLEKLGGDGTNLYSQLVFASFF